MSAIQKRKVQRRNAVGGDTTVLKSVHWYVAGDLTTGVKFRFRVPEAGTYVSTKLNVGTAVTTDSAIFDVHKNGTTLYTTQASRPTIAATETESTEAATADVTTLAEGDILIVEVDDVDTGNTGADLSICVQYLARVSA
jgi:hypothetical protein